jgi:hypothetical protein
VDEGATVGVTKTHRELSTKVGRFVEDLEVITDGKKYDTNIVRNWKGRVFFYNVFRATRYKTTSLPAILNQARRIDTLL